MAEGAGRAGQVRAGHAREHARRERQPGAQLGPLGDERRQLVERVDALAGERDDRAHVARGQAGS